MRSRRCRRVVIVKLGGAALTNKRAVGELAVRGFRDGVRAIATVVRESSDANGVVVVVHGAGGFGHGTCILYTHTRRYARETHHGLTTYDVRRR